MSDNGFTPRPRAGLGQRWFAWFQSGSGSPTLARVVDAYKRRLLADLRGLVVELGPGTGANFDFLPDGIHWLGIEPNVFMHAQLRAAAEVRGLSPDIRAYEAERLPFADGSVDVVVATHMLCSVRDQGQVVAEVLRVLAPGGRFVFVEHVAAPPGTRTRLIQQLVQPLWQRVGDGCHVTRETGSAIEQAGFARVEAERFAVPLPVAGPHIAGVAWKDGGD